MIKKYYIVNKNKNKQFMKNVILSLLVASILVACNSSDVKTDVKTDSTKVDSVKVDSTKSDSIRVRYDGTNPVVDTIKK